jgi:hypothetical protein
MQKENCEQFNEETVRAVQGEEGVSGAGRGGCEKEDL